MNNNPERTFYLVALVVAILLGMYFLPQMQIMDTPLRPVRMLSDILPDSTEMDDTVIIEYDSIKNNNIIWPEGVQPIEDYSENEAGGMEHFYSTLANRDELDRPVRIAYYGDSFIEGDILTADLRVAFQEEYGGNGVGWVDCGTKMVQYRRSIRQSSGGIHEYSVKEKPFDVSRQSLCQRYYIPNGSAWVETKAADRFYEIDQKWTLSHLYFRAPNGLRVASKTSNGITNNEIFPASGNIQMCSVRDTMNSIRYDFPGASSSTTLFGIALESEKGVILDNFSMRGSNGISLADIPENTLKDFAQLRPYDLIIIQFGINQAASGNTKAILELYVKNLGKAVKHFRETYPDASILVVSLPDRDQRSSNGIKTMKVVKSIVALQQSMAKDNHVCFYNFYQAMGGESSMAELVDKGLANKDYTHINVDGGKYLASKMFKSFKAAMEGR